jgi:glucose/arabinose dehydrogenase
MTFYTGSQFPTEYTNDAFAAQHGSWNRSVKAGHEVVRVPLEDGKSDGVYQDFVTGFIDSDGRPWGRPVGVAVAHDGSLLVTDDETKIIWRISHTGRTGSPGRVRADE